MTKQNKSKIIQFVVIVVCVVIFSYLRYNSIQISNIDRIGSLFHLENSNSRNATPQELFNETWVIIKNNYYQKDLNKQNWSKWKKRYKNKIKTMEDADVAINTMITSLNDPYSKFLNENEFSEQNNSINSKLYGIGINIASISGKIVIVNVLKDAPADKQGIKSGDIIIKINDTEVSGQSVYQVAQLIRGDKDAIIDMEVLRADEKIAKSIKREEIKIKTVEYKNLDDDIGYLRVSSFIGLNTAKEFVVGLNKLKDTKALILDLRGNSGGLFQNALIISDLFINSGVITKVIARHNKQNVYKANENENIYKNPMVILIDEDTASTSEILASALHDNNRAVLVGTKTFGKGLVQKVFFLPNKTGMNITIARYLTPNGNDINNKGLEPDYYVTIAHGDFIDNVDSQLVWAKNYLKLEISK